MASQPLRIALPNEILHDICMHLPQKDVASLRLTSKALAAVGRHLWNEVRFVLEERCVARLEQISKHPDISQYVRTLTYEVDSLPDYISKDELNPKPIDREIWESFTRHPCFEPHEESYWQLSEDRLREGWIEYQRIRLYQQQLHANSRRRRALLARIVAGFPNLSKVQLESEKIDHYGWALPSCKKYYKAALVGPDRREVISYWPGDLELKDLLIIIAKGKQRIRHLSLPHCAAPFFERINEEIDLIESIEQGLKNITHLSIMVSFSHIRYTQRSLRQRPMAKFLAKAPSLQELNLGFAYIWDTEPEELPVSLKNIIGQLT